MYAGNESATELTDTSQFLSTLAEICSSLSPGSDERIAAQDLFDWEEEITVARAPGRLDVMGGIADYSGSLVLQMPIAEACHVALQRVGHAAAREEPRSTTGGCYDDSCPV